MHVMPFHIIFYKKLNDCRGFVCEPFMSPFSFLFAIVPVYVGLCM